MNITVQLQANQLQIYIQIKIHFTTYGMYFKIYDSSGTNEITMQIFEKLNDGILEVLSQAINSSFCSGIFPSCLKTAIVIPVHKSGS